MRERPILFSAPMVTALLEGRKHQTRRLVKFEHAKEVDAWAQDQDEPLMWRMGVYGDGGALADMGALTCPHGQPGDRLWAKEALKQGKMVSLLTGGPTNADVAFYAADGAPVLLQPGDFDAGWCWSRSVLPSIFMPRWASRITLETTEVRVERLQDISEEDAIAEGLEPSPIFKGWRWSGPKGCGAASDPRHAYASLWDDLNGNKPGASWADNPWCWAISFRRAEASHG